MSELEVVRFREADDRQGDYECDGGRNYEGEYVPADVARKLLKALREIVEYDPRWTSEGTMYHANYLTANFARTTARKAIWYATGEDATR